MYTPRSNSNNQFRRNQLYCGAASNVGYNHCGKQRFNTNDFSSFQENMETTGGGVRRVLFNEVGGGALHNNNGPFQGCPSAQMIHVEGGDLDTHCQPHYNNKPLRMGRQINSFQNEGQQVVRTYMQCSPGQAHQSRFVKIQGCKMKPPAFRNFTYHQKNKQLRRFAPKNFNYKPHNHNRTVDFRNSNYAFQFQEGNNSYMIHQNIPEPSHAETQRTTNVELSENNQETNIRWATTNKNKKCNNKCRKVNCRANQELGLNIDHQKFVEPKVESNTEASPSPHDHDLSYEDISENSNEESDLEFSPSDSRERRSRLFRKGRKIKREPGEICSDEEKCEIKNYTTETARVSESKVEKNKDKNKAPKTEKRTAPVGSSSSANSNLQRRSGGHDIDRYSEFKKTRWSASHDDRCARNDYDSKSYGSVKTGSDTHSNSDNTYCFETEVTDLKEKMDKVKQRLRKTRDKLLEVEVVGSKKAVRLQEEIDDLTNRLSESQKKENGLADTLKILENEIAEKDANLMKMSGLYETEKREKTKFQVDLTRTYQDRLAMVKENLRGLFEVEVAKMQTYFLSKTVYGGSPFMNNLSSNEAKNPEDIFWRHNVKPTNNLNASESLFQNNLSFSHVPFPIPPVSPFILQDNYGQSRFPYESTSGSQFSSFAAQGASNVDSNTTIGSSGVESERNVEILLSSCQLPDQ